MSSELEAASREIEVALPLVEQLAHEMQRRIVGQPVLIERLLIGLVTGGHVLLEGVPGLAKTLAARTLAEAVGLGFGRVQFTPDLLPSDLLGTLVYDRRTGQFVPHYGPIFTNILLADEINRAPAKVQSALLESMQERRVTIGDTTYRLPEPFLVLATQNPIEHEGTYALPEAQIDRFMLKVLITYPDRSSEREMLDLLLGVGPEVTGDAGNADAIRITPVIDAAGVALCRRAAHAVYADDRIRDYVLRLVEATRPSAATRIESIREHVRYGASPRATLYLTLAAKAHAFLRHRPYVVPEDVKSIAPDVLRHRIVLTYEAEADEITPDDVVRKVLDKVAVP
ncbi:MAG TPA: AAA family ATPase [Blastocatellia bacterium]|nr:AAA family ATPase [Blastocatellia bacterium]